jgi:hypothetical protein
MCGDALLRVTPWGYNIAIWCTLIAVAMAIAFTRLHRNVGRDVAWLLLPFLAFAVALAVRDSPSLRALNLVGILVVCAMAMGRVQGGKVRIGSVRDYTMELVWTWLTAIGEVHNLFGKDIAWRELGGERRRAKVAAVGLGLAAAVPVLIVFGALLVSADDVFRSYVSRLCAWDVNSVCTSIALIPIFSWLCAALLRRMLIGTAAPAPRDVLSDDRRVGITEVGIVLGSLDLMFLAFVVVQFKWFFGGDALVRSPIPLTYSQYAHHGVFELVTVCALALMLLLGAHWLVRQDSSAAIIVFRSLAATMVAMLFVIAASAWQRIVIYIDAYGLSVPRFWVAALIVWLAVVFLWFAATVLRGKADRFAFGAVASALLIVLSADIANPEACIVRVNIRQENRRFDAAYAAGLSADAIPELVADLPKLSAEHRGEVAARLILSHPASSQADFRTMNMSTGFAVDVLERDRARLSAWAAPYLDKIKGDTTAEDTGTGDE